LSTCPVCGTSTPRNRKFCSRACVRQAYRQGLIVNRGNFRPGSVSLNKGRTLESWVGEERAREIKARMSINSRGKAPQLRRLNDDPTIMARRLASRKFHDQVVSWLAKQLRERGLRVFVLSEYIKEKRIPDAIIFDGKALTALEVETDKRWKPSHASTQDRLVRMNSFAHFFDGTKVVFPKVGEELDETGPSYLNHVLT
jgi:hypothetical protein